MAQAIRLAIEAKKAGELPFGAVVVRGNKVVARGRCREKQHSSVLAHAEAEAVHRACKKLATTKLSNCTIYCTNEPCVMCAAAIFQAKIPRVIIGASRGDIRILRPREVNIDVLAADSGYDIEIVRGVSKEFILDLFRGVKV